MASSGQRMRPASRNRKRELAAGWRRVIVETPTLKPES